MPQIVCPLPEELLRLASGAASGNEAEQLAEHVATCHRCAGAFESLSSSDPLLGALRGQTPVEPEERFELDSFVVRMEGMLRPGDESSTKRRGGTAPSSRQAEESAAIGDMLDSPHQPDELGRIGNYRVLEAIGWGGMGIVLRAEDARLKRVVAIKLIRDARPSILNLSRFEQEGKSIARLDHPHIVQVYEVGRHRGRPYLVLEYVADGTLAERMEGRPQPVRASARLMVLLARAVQHAHEQGVVHRDLKPANVLLRGNAASGLDEILPKIADFGLAKHVDEPGVTKTGEVLGTPSYMAPELTRGLSKGAIDEPLVDVYALGAILFEMLTGRPPFRGETTPDTFEQVRTLEPVPPRRLPPGTPRDLETICLKCLAKEPRRRYRSAKALADDLDRYLDNRPIEARPAGRIERLAKWSRRRPALAALAVVSTVALGVLIIGGAVYERKLQKALKTATDNAVAARTAEKVAKSDRARADANYREAREALYQMLRLIDDRSLADIPKLKELQHRQFEQALKYYASVASRESSDPEARRDAAGAVFETGRLQEALGKNAEAAASFEKAAAEFAALADEFPSDASLRVDRAKALLSLAFQRRTAGDLDAAIRLGEQSLAIVDKASEDAAGGGPLSEELLSELAQAHFGLAGSYFEARLSAAGSAEDDDWRSAEKHYLKALELTARVASAAPGDFTRRRGLARCWINLSVLYQQRPDRAEDCEKYHKLAADALASLAADDPLDVGSICNLAQLRVNWGYVLFARGEADRALEDLAQNVSALQALLEREPELALAKEMLFRTHGVRAQILDALGRFADSVGEWEAVVAHGAPDRSRARTRLALALAQSNRYAEAVAEAESIAAEPDVQKNVVVLGRLAQTYSLAIAGAERDGAGAAVDARIEQYVNAAVIYLGKAKAVGDEAPWAQLAAELKTDEGFAPLRTRLNAAQLAEFQ